MATESVSHKTEKADAANFAAFGEACSNLSNGVEQQEAFAGIPLLGRVLVPTSSGAGPRSFAVVSKGDCMEPLFSDGDSVVVDPDQVPKAGDTVMISRKQGVPLLKRLSSDLLIWPVNCDRGGNAIPIIECEQINPPMKYAFPENRLYGVFRVVGKGVKESEVQRRA